jgi:hypothetical protein
MIMVRIRPVKTRVRVTGRLVAEASVFEVDCTKSSRKIKIRRQIYTELPGRTGQAKSDHPSLSDYFLSGTETLISSPTVSFP